MKQRLNAHGEIALFIALLPVVLYLCFANLSQYPIISGFDEGIYLQFAQNLAQYKQYASLSGGQFCPLDPVGGTGPTLILPVAAVLTVAQGSLEGARLVMALYLLAAIAGVYLVVRWIDGWLSAALSVLLFLTAGYATYDTLWLGRQVLAEVPALAFFLWGLWAWLKSWRGARGWLYLSAALFALAIITKNQLILLAFPGFFLLAIADHFYYRQLSWTHFVFPLGGFLAGYVSWQLVSWLIVGPAAWPAYVQGVNALTRASFMHFGLSQWKDNLRMFFSSSVPWLLSLATILYGLFLGRKKSLVGLAQVVLPLLAVIALASFLGFDLPWARYLYLPLALVALFGGVFISNASQWIGARLKPTGLWTGTIVIVLMIVSVAPRFVDDFRSICTTNDTDASDFAAALDEKVPQGQEVLNWEWEVEFYSHSDFVNPPYRLFSALVDEEYNQRTDSILEQSCIPDDIQYLVVGPFATQIDVFDEEMTTRNPKPLVSVGPYTLYQLALQTP